MQGTRSGYDHKVPITTSEFRTEYEVQYHFKIEMGFEHFKCPYSLVASNSSRFAVVKTIHKSRLQVEDVMKGNQTMS